MSSIQSPRSRAFLKHLEICVGGIGHQTEPHTLLYGISRNSRRIFQSFSRTYFEQFGTINHYNFTAPNGRGFVFITYETKADVDRCIANRPHRLDGRHL